jgi:hypothetical protein
MIVPTIVLLFFPTDPSAVAWFVITVVFLAVNREVFGVAIG